MAIPGSQVAPVNAAQFFGVVPAAPRKSLDMNGFIQLLTVQLEHQDPLQPMEDKDMFAQMAQLGQVQGLDQVKQSLEVTQAAALIGKTVMANRPASDTTSTDPTVTGVVSGLSINNGNYMLNLTQADGGTVQVDIGSIQTVGN